MQLPFLYVHGALVWKVLLVILVLGTCGVLARLRTAVARWDARKRLSWWRAIATDLKIGKLTVRGVIIEGSASTLEGRYQQEDARSGDLVIEVGDQRVRVIGDVRVNLGSQARRAPARRGRMAIPRRVGQGDEVFATGVAAFADGAWTIAPVDARVELAAITPDAPRHPLGRATWAILVLVFGGLWYGALHAIGSTALEHAGHDGGLFVRVAGFDALAVAAAMPGSNRGALSTLEYRLRQRFERSEGAFELRMKLLEDAGSCPSAELLDALRLDDSLAAAKRCGTAEEEALALAFLGRYHEAAARAKSGSRLAVQLAIVEKRWGDAAGEIEATGSSFDRCFGALMRTWAGEPDPFAHLAADDDRACATMRALALPDQRVAAALEEVSRDEDRTITIDTVDELSLVFGGDPAQARLAVRATTSALDSWGDESAWWLAPWILKVQGERDPALAAELHVVMGSLAIQRGDLAAARDQLASARAMDSAGYLTASLAAAIAILEPSPLPAQVERVYLGVHVGDAVEARRGTGRHLVGSVYPHSCEPELLAAMKGAAAGDGADLARILRRCELLGENPSMLFGVLPEVTAHRAELAATLRVPKEELSFGAHGAFPYGIAAAIARKRDLARLAGDAEDAARWRAIYDRETAPLQERDVVIALMLLEEMR